MGLTYQTFYYLARAVAHSCFDFRVVNREGIPREGGMVLAVNHQSFLDPPLAGISCDREIYYLARKSLMNHPVAGAILSRLNVVPYDQSGADMTAIKNVIRLLRKGEAVVVFPEGTRSRSGELQEAQSGLGMIVAKTRVPVVPMRIFGAHSAFAPDTLRIQWEPVTLVVGEVMRFGDADFEGGTKAAYRRVSAAVMDKIGALRCPPRRPVIS